MADPLAQTPSIQPNTNAQYLPIVAHPLSREAVILNRFPTTQDEWAEVDDWRRLKLSNTFFADRRRRRSLDGLPSIDSRLMAYWIPEDRQGAPPSHASGSSGGEHRPRRHSDAPSPRHEPVMLRRDSSASLDERGKRKVRFVLGVDHSPEPTQVFLDDREPTNSRGGIGHGVEIQGPIGLNTHRAGAANIEPGPRGMPPPRPSPSPGLPFPRSFVSYYAGGVAGSSNDLDRATPTRISAPSTYDHDPYKDTEYEPYEPEITPTPATPFTPTSHLNPFEDDEVEAGPTPSFSTSRSGSDNGMLATTSSAPSNSTTSSCLPSRGNAILRNGDGTVLATTASNTATRRSSPTIYPDAYLQQEQPINTFLGNFTEAFIMFLSRDEADSVRATVRGVGHLEEYQVPGDDRILLVYSETMCNWNTISRVAIIRALPGPRLLRFVIRAMHSTPVAFALLISALLASSSLSAALIWLVILAWDIDNLVPYTMAFLRNGPAVGRRAVRNTMQVILQIVLRYLEQFRDPQIVAAGPVRG
ncbi:hypothetical protein FA13DRAFT_1798505 [Coprinellus micaceus]|uniref:Uncharacterized protein n=1 Tax=Coprinellus micaceus TaxID=71717 RepID=A0A4Y7SNU1_COPMI|nr:hypothetical protein FA13DRAFT_1798505 [Coprinellus micaceus]